MQNGNPVEAWDYVDLALLRMAKIGRSKLHQEDGDSEFYNRFFNANDVQVMTSGGDLRRVHRGEIMTKAVWDRLPTQGGMVVDVGCGTGDNLLYVYRPGTRFVGIEYAEQTARFARSLLGERAEVHAASATAIPLPDACCDVALCIEVIEHIQDEGGALSEIARILRPGGNLVLSLPYRHWFPLHVQLIGHFRHYTRSDVVTLLSRHGLDVEQYLPNYPRWSRFANYCYVTARLYVLLLRIFGVRRSPVEVCAPFSRKKLIDKLFERIAPIRAAEQHKDYSQLETSTFLVARKRLTIPNGGGPS